MRTSFTAEPVAIKPLQGVVVLNSKRVDLD